MGYIGQTPSAVPLDGSDIADDIVDSQHYAAGSIDTAHLADDQITLAKMAAGTDGNIISYDASGNPVAIATGSDGQVLTSAGAGQPCAFETLSAGKVLQVVNVLTGTSQTGTTVLNPDNTTHLITEGVEYYTLAITPSSTSNVLRIDAMLHIGVPAARLLTFSIFNTDVHSTDALATTFQYTATNTYVHTLTLTHFMNAPTAGSATTFRLRAGVETSGTVYINKHNDADFYNGRLRSGIVITEIAA